MRTPSDHSTCKPPWQKHETRSLMESGPQLGHPKRGAPSLLLGSDTAGATLAEVPDLKRTSIGGSTRGPPKAIPEGDRSASMTNAGSPRRTMGTIRLRAGAQRAARSRTRTAQPRPAACDRASRTHPARFGIRAAEMQTQFRGPQSFEARGGTFDRPEPTSPRIGDDACRDQKLRRNIRLRGRSEARR
ncbi:hypothetical protein NUW54_g7406 [Trametes sanguinea]|uniref:Uncharacterized protein n=1 Tax=Trametes sanguinea TaxID=158606 RepID=A0ACC1PNS0_9APHY|nr:hypothetical protein NUW54_g7406 [Trametes sanguinea]